MTKKYRYFEEIAKFVVAYCPAGKMIKKLPLNFDNSKTKAQLENFFSKNNQQEQFVYQEYIILSSENFVPAFLEVFWKKLSAGEREQAIRLAYQKLCKQKFDGTITIEEDGQEEISAFVIEGQKVYLNLGVLTSSMSPSQILGQILAIPFEKRKSKYLSVEFVKNILDIESFEQLGCLYEFAKDDISQNKTGELSELECIQLDTITNREYRNQQETATNLLLDACNNLSCLPVDDWQHLHDELEILAHFSDIIDNTLESNQEFRDKEFVIKCNKELNKIAQLQGRTNDLVSNEIALAHFGFVKKEKQNEQYLAEPMSFDA